MVRKYIKEDEFSSVKESGGIVADNLSINSVIRPEADASEIEAEAGGFGDGDWHGSSSFRDGFFKGSGF